MANKMAVFGVVAGDARAPAEALPVPRKPQNSSESDELPVFPKGLRDGGADGAGRCARLQVREEAPGCGLAGASRL